jgi:hypothetical protein
MAEQQLALGEWRDRALKNKVPQPCFSQPHHYSILDPEPKTHPTELNQMDCISRAVEPQNKGPNKYTSETELCRCHCITSHNIMQYTLCHNRYTYMCQDSVVTILWQVMTSYVSCYDILWHGYDRVTTCYAARCQVKFYPKIKYCIIPKEMGSKQSLYAMNFY